MPPLSLADVREVVELATLAPSVHNTQPWRFSWDGQALTVHEDSKRSLPVLDPDGRERVLSCGAAAQHAELAVRIVGHHATTDIGASQDDRTRIARITVGPPAEASEDEHALATAIPRRYTDRGIFEPDLVSADAVHRLQTAAQHHSAWLRPVVRPDERVALAVLLAHADAAEQTDPAYRAELARWRSHDREQEGIPDAALPDGPVRQRGSEFTLRDFDGGPSAERPVEPPIPEHPLAVVLGTDGDGREDWIQAGMALGRVLLQATVDDLATSPMTQIVEVETFRARLRKELGLVGMPQVVLRIGRGHGRMTTLRRPVDDVLDVTA